MVASGVRLEGDRRVRRGDGIFVAFDNSLPLRCVYRGGLVVNVNGTVLLVASHGTAFAEISSMPYL
jgi:hypothetical protein